MSDGRCSVALRNAMLPVFAAAVTVAGCEADTNLLIVIDGDLAVPAEVDTLELSVAAGTQGFDHVFALGAGAALPQSLVLQPGSYEGTEVSIEVVGRLGGEGGREVARGSATAAFASGEQVRVEVTLEPTCADVRCRRWEWCAANECVPRPCESSTVCDDGSPCNGVETCVGGTCAVGEPPACDDGVACTFDLCSDELGGCTTLPDHRRCGRSTELCTAEGCAQRSCTSQADCDDRVSCNGFETCSGTRCVAGTPPDCDDGIACTVDLCDEQSGGCLSQPDHDLCGVGELCLPELGGCTALACDGDAAPCSDGVACNGLEQCVDGACAPAAAIDDPCDDGDECSTDLCKPGGCLHWLIDADGDGYPPTECGGLDCDDTSPVLGPSGTEACDGADNDCDGDIDEDFDCVLDAVVACETACGTTGTATCLPGCELGGCEPPAETCNLVDDDCDDLVDEDTFIGQPTGGRRVTDAPTSSRAAALATNPEGGLGLAWDDSRHGDSEIYFLALDDAAAPVGTAVRVTNAPGDSWAPDLAWTGASFLVVWTDARPGGTEIYMQWLQPSGAAIDSALQVTFTGGNASAAAIAWAGEFVGLVWVERVAGDDHVKFCLLGDLGCTAAGVTITAAGAAATAPDLVWTGTEYGVAWTDAASGDEEIYFSRVSSTGAVLATPTRLTETAGTSRDVSLAWTGHEYVLAWSDRRSEPMRILASLLDATGHSIEDEVPLTSVGNATAPAVIWSGDAVALVWAEETPVQSIYFARLTETLGPLDSPLLLSAGGVLADLPALASTSSGLAVAWHDRRAGGDNDEIYTALVSCPP
jgi:hypothetical protein